MSCVVETDSHWLAVISHTNNGKLRLAVCGTDVVVQLTHEEARDLAAALVSEVEREPAPDDNAQVL